MPENQINNINPSIRTTTIGVRNLKELTMYPLSLGELLKLSFLVTEIVHVANEYKNGTDEEVIKAVMDLIHKHIYKILKLVSNIDELNKGFWNKLFRKNVLNEMSIEQSLNIAELIFEMNFETCRKKFKSLQQKIKAENQ